MNTEQTSKNIFMGNNKVLQKTMPSSYHIIYHLKKHLSKPVLLITYTVEKKAFPVAIF